MLSTWRHSGFNVFCGNRISPADDTARSNVLVRQVKLGESSWLKSQSDKVSRPSEPSFAFMQVTAWVKRKQDDRRP
jgi:hypothetical protein